MTDHKTGTREQWLAARLELLEAEKALTRRSDELARQRQELPWVRIDKQYRFETGAGTAQPEPQPRACILAAAPAEVPLDRRELADTRRDHHRARGHRPVRPVQRVHRDAH